MLSGMPRWGAAGARNGGAAASEGVCLVLSLEMIDVDGQVVRCAKAGSTLVRERVRQFETVPLRRILMDWTRAFLGGEWQRVAK